MSSTRTYDHRAFVGPADRFDLSSASQFNILTALGLREHHTLLDIGCGSLRAGRLLIPYLKPGNYFGIEPEQWLIDSAFDQELGRDLLEVRKPTFSNDCDFTLTIFKHSFDFLLAQSIFSHASQAQIRRCLAEAAAALAPTGIFAATFFVGDHDYDGAVWVYPGRVYYTMQRMTEMCREAGLSCQSLNWTHTNDQTWIAITHPAHAANVPELADTNGVGILQHRLATTQHNLADIQKMMGFKLMKRINRILGRAPRGLKK